MSCLLKNIVIKHLELDFTGLMVFFNISGFKTNLVLGHSFLTFCSTIKDLTIFAVLEPQMT